MSQAVRQLTAEEVQSHGPTSSEPWVVIGHQVYNVGRFHALHPGGSKLLLNACGLENAKKATTDFFGVHHPTLLEQPKYEKLLVGVLPMPKPKTAKERRAAAALPIVPAPAVSGQRMTDHYWMVDPHMTSPFFTDQHRDFVLWLRETNKKLGFTADQVNKWDESGKYPKELLRALYKAGIHGMMFPKEYGGTGVPIVGKPGSKPPLQWDPFVAMIMFYESSRSGSTGLGASTGSLQIALPPILAHGTHELKEKYGRPMIEGRAIGALCITEPWAGSDVSRIRSSCVQDPGSPDHLILNGEKKFITSGVEADYLTVAVRTKPSKEAKNIFDGISLIVVESKWAGVSATRMKTQGWWASNTAYITFEDVKVPKANVIGEIHQGFRYIMTNFNNERFMMCCNCAASCHNLIRESIRYAKVRQTFGQPLINHQVIRHKVAEMSLRTEALYAQLEQLAFLLSTKAPHVDVGPKIALCKVLATKTYELCAREASQVLGGNSYQRSGQGQLVERLYRDVRVQAIGGGSEEIMMDLGVRMSNL